MVLRRLILFVGLAAGLAAPRAGAADTPPDATPVLELSEVDEVPVALLQPQAQLPENAAAPRPGEPVPVTFVVDEAGMVREARLMNRDVPAEVETAVLAVLAKWRFRPAREAGRPVATRLTTPVSFAGDEGAAPSAVRTVTIVPADELDRAPLLRYQSTPVYPPELRQRGIGGEVIVDFLIDERGIVRQPRAITAPHTALAEAAEVAVAQWTFFPAMKDGRPVVTRLQAPILFTPSGN